MNTIRITGLTRKTGMARSTIYAAIASGSFPRPIKLGSRAVGWLEDEVDDWLASKVAARGELHRGGL